MKLKVLEKRTRYKVDIDPMHFGPEQCPLQLECPIGYVCPGDYCILCDYNYHCPPDIFPREGNI